MYVYCVESFPHIECYSDCSRRGSHLLLCYLVCIVPSLYSVVLCNRVACVCAVGLLLYKDVGSSAVSAITERGIWACMRCPCLRLCWDGDYVNQLSYMCRVATKGHQCRETVNIVKTI